MVCVEKNIEYVLTQCLLGSPELFAIHPFGKMPVLRHGDFELYESKAIAAYLDRAFPGPALFPSEPRLAALTEQWVSLVNSETYGTVQRYVLAYVKPNTPDGSPDRAAMDAVKPQLLSQLAILDRAVAATGYLVGDQLTFADLNLLTILHNVRQLPGAAEALAAATHLASYHVRHSSRPSYASTIPPPGPPRRATPQQSS
jgi:glutathione S-transferase